MARIRTVKPEFWTDSTIVQLTPYARLLYIGMWNFADDYGCIDDDPLQLKLQILPADDVDPETLITELLESGRVTRCANDEGQTFLRIRTWDRHQKVDSRAKPRFGDPDNWTPRQTPPNPAESRPEIGQEGKGREGKGEEGKPPAGATRAPTRATPLPDDWQPNPAHQQLAAELGVDCQDQADRMRDWAKAKGETGKDWDARFRNWLRKAPELGQHPARASPPNGVPERLTAAEQRTQRNRANIASARAKREQMGHPP